MHTPMPDTHTDPEPTPSQPDPPPQQPAEPSATTSGEPTTPEDRESSLQFWVVFAGLVVALVLFNMRGDPASSRPSVMQPGAVVDAPITLITADRNDLACAREGDVDGFACAFTAPGVVRISQTAADRVLAPYMTTQGQLFLVAGLFEQPAVEERFRKEPPEGKKREELRRFTAQCKLRLLSEIEVRMRWAPQAPWGEPSRAWASVPVSCRVSTL